MTKERSILTQVLGVSHRSDSRGHEALVYCPSPLMGEDRVPDPLCKMINSSILNNQIENIRCRVEDLLCRARSGKARDDLGIEADANALATHILPETGFVSVLPPGIHPQFDIVYDLASEIPGKSWKNVTSAVKTRIAAHRLSRQREPRMPDEVCTASFVERLWNWWSASWRSTVT